MRAERLSFAATVPPWVRDEHAARFRFSAQFVAGKKVVDCAAGALIGSSGFASAGAKRVIAIDRSILALADAPSSNALASLLIVPIGGDAMRLPLHSQSADVFISLETIEHLDDARMYLGEVHRVLRPDGRFICSTPNRAVTNPGTTISDPPFNRFHVREYDEEQFASLLRQYFGHVELFAQNPQNRLNRWIADGVARASTRAAVLFRQTMKMSGFFIPNHDRHEVRPIAPGVSYEYLVAVCAAPKGSAR